MIKIRAVAFSVLLSCSLTSSWAEDVSMKLEVRHAIDRGVKWLGEHRDAKHFWSDANYPALTALPLAALLLDPSRDREAPLSSEVESSLDWILSLVKQDGGIYGKGLGNYNTSVSMMALILAERPQDEKVLLQARRFLTNQQQDYGVRGEQDHTLDGGIGYGSSYAHSDLSNTHLALEALYYSKSLIQDKPEEAAYKLNWDAAIAFVSKCQNLPETNSEPWVSGDPANRGGFIYFPGDSKSGEQKLPDGKVALRSYGSMGYAGMLSFIYADLDQSDPRMMAVLQWLTENYAVDENPGMGAEGLYYYYHTMAKALTLADVKELTLKDGTKVNWRSDLCKKLFDLQNPDGSWANATQRWWEGDAVLATSYALLAMERLYPGL
ncbi:MAG: squalene-hopene/tetraprenyl-beta-curcumene cyclase [Verrucomicrobiales bacterium]|jgi:squalene-hopene/tetraprenyl-beta-curcumene cyclase